MIIILCMDTNLIKSNNLQQNYLWLLALGDISNVRLEERYRPCRII